MIEYASRIAKPIAVADKADRQRAIAATLFATNTEDVRLAHARTVQHNVDLLYSLLRAPDAHDVIEVAGGRHPSITVNPVFTVADIDARLRAWEHVYTNATTATDTPTETEDDE
ncbi:hypothetical protein ACFOJ6_13105 [Gordonia humi]|uniref:hypothetical protein n=1 Tax=Gordonia humi TaxID=686429 RepID=UPI003608298F